MRQRAECLRSIPLPSVLLAAGAEQDRSDKAQWHTPQGVLSVTGMKFMNWNRATGGGGAIDLVIHLYGLDFRGAVAWLCHHFPSCTAAQPPCPAPRQNLQLPSPCSDKLCAVKHYLAAQRRISPAQIQRLIQAGTLYADHRANAVFILRDKHNATVGAELRGTGRYPWRGMAPGSRKHLGYFSIRDTRIDGIILCESAIDAISCLAIHPHHWCISTAGARPNPSWLPPLIRLGPPLHCGFDADPTGDAMAQAMIQLHPAIKRLRPPHHDWNDLLRSITAVAHPADSPTVLLGSHTPIPSTWK